MFGLKSLIKGPPFSHPFWLKCFPFFVCLIELNFFDYVVWYQSMSQMIQISLAQLGSAWLSLAQLGSAWVGLSGTCPIIMLASKFVIFIKSAYNLVSYTNFFIDILVYVNINHWTIGSHWGKKSKFMFLSIHRNFLLSTNAKIKKSVWINVKFFIVVTH